MTPKPAVRAKQLVRGASRLTANAHGDVRDEQTTGPTSREGSSRSNDQTGTCCQRPLPHEHARNAPMAPPMAIMEICLGFRARCVSSSLGCTPSPPETVTSSG